MLLNGCTRTSAVFGLAVLGSAVFSAVLGTIVPTQAAEPKLVVTTDPGSDPESVTEAPDGSLILGSAAKPVIYRDMTGYLIGVDWWGCFKKEDTVKEKE